MSCCGGGDDNERRRGSDENDYGEFIVLFEIQLLLNRLSGAI